MKYSVGCFLGGLSIDLGFLTNSSTDYDNLESSSRVVFIVYIIITSLILETLECDDILFYIC